MDDKGGAATIHRVPAFQDNYIWLFEYAPGRAAAIDPGDAAATLAAASGHGLAITHILNTHWHADHVGGNLAIKEATGCRIIGPAREADRIPGLDRPVDAGDRVGLGTHVGDVLYVGAHTLGHIAFHFRWANALFSGDTLFAMGCGRLFEGTADDLWAAFRQFDPLGDECCVYAAHEYTLANARFAVTAEPDNEALSRRYAEVQAARAQNWATVPFTLGEERATNPFLRATSPAELAARRSAKDVF